MTSIFNLMTTFRNLPSGPHVLTRRACCIALVLGVTLAIHVAVSAAEASKDAGHVFHNGIRIEDEIVVVNVRPLCGSTLNDSNREVVRVENYANQDDSGHRRWMRSDLDRFLSFDPSVPTIIFVHGNQITEGDAKSEGLSVYRKLLSYAPNSDRIRFVIFSWPSAKAGRLLQDVRIKAARTGPAAQQLAWLVDQMPAETPVSFVGFSFGARIITGGLHILGGGSLGGSKVLTERVHPDRVPMNAVLIVAALHAHWLGEGQYHGLALSQVNQMLLINNCQDRAMVYYHFLTPGRGGPQGLGLRGPTRLDPQYASQVHKRDVSRYVGSQHDLYRYLCAPGAMGQIWDYTAGAAAVEPAHVAALSGSGAGG